MTAVKQPDFFPVVDYPAGGEPSIPLPKIGAKLSLAELDERVDLSA